MPLDDERRTDHRQIATVSALPHVMTHHHDRRRCRGIVGGAEDATAEGLHAEGREIVAGDILSAERPCRRADVLAPHAQPPPPATAPAAGLEGRDLLELGQVGLQALEQWVREHAPAILRPALNAAAAAI